MSKNGLIKSRQTFLEFISDRNQRMKTLVSSYISEVDRLRMRERRKSCAVQEWGSNAYTDTIRQKSIV